MSTMEVHQQRDLLHLVYRCIRALNAATVSLDVGTHLSRPPAYAVVVNGIEGAFPNIIEAYNALVEARNILCSSLDTPPSHSFGDDRSSVSSYELTAEQEELIHPSVPEPDAEPAETGE